MFILYAPFKNFGVVPPRTALFTPSILFTDNLASTHSRYWRDFAVTKGVLDITPKSLLKLQKKRFYKDVLFIVLGGIGDILWSLPVIKAFKLKYPQCRITLHVSKEYFSLLLNNPFIHQFTFLPPQYVPLMFHIFDEILDFGGAVVGHSEEKVKHAVDLYFERARLPLPLKTEDRASKIFLNDVEKALVFSFLKTKNIDPLRDPIAVINTESSAPIRTYPPARTRAIALALAEKGFKVFLVGRSKAVLDIDTFFCACGFEFTIRTQKNFPSLSFQCPDCGKINKVDIGTTHPNLIPLIGATDFRFCTCLIYQSDLFIGPDSGLLHIAAASSVPSVGLYGPIPAHLRTKYYEKHATIEGRCPKKRCFKHKPVCPISDPSPCLLDISPDLVIKTSLSLYEKFKGDKFKKWSGIEKLLKDPKLLKLGNDFSRIFSEKALTSAVDPIKLVNQRLGLTNSPSRE